MSSPKRKPWQFRSLIRPEEGRAVLVLLAFLLLVLGYQVWQWLQTPHVERLAIELTEGRSHPRGSQQAKPSSTEKVKSVTELQLDVHAFDPNLISSEEMLAMGLPPHAVKGWVNARNRGYVFRDLQDLARLNCLPPLFYQQLAPFARFTSLVQSNAQKDAKRVVLPANQLFDLNAADSNALVALKYIGPGLAKRIVGLRQRLGGFIAYEQLERYHVLDSVELATLRQASYIDPDFNPKRVPINQAGWQQLEQHPEIPHRLATALVQYRGQHGPFKDKVSLLQLKMMDTARLNRLMPYLSFE